MVRIILLHRRLSPLQVLSAFPQQIGSLTGSLRSWSGWVTLIGLVCIFSLAPLAVNGQTPRPVEASKKVEQMKINIIIDGKTATAILENSPEAREFASMLPMEVNFQDYASREKFAYLSRKLTAGGSGTNKETSAWDLTYHVSLGSIAFFYKDYEPIEGLVKIGRIDSGKQILTQKSGFKAKIELAQNHQEKVNE